MTVRVLGAGLSGLSCAIHLTRTGREVEVNERRSGVGCHIQPNLQGIGFGGERARDFFGGCGLPQPKVVRKFTKVFFLTPERELSLNLAEPYNFVFRGGRDSLEYDLYRHALEAGVSFHFNSRKHPSEADVVATGPRRADAVAVGGAYENVNLPSDTMLMMFDDRFSPSGWYSYMLPLGDNLVEVVNCVPHPFTHKARELIEDAVKKRPFIRDLMADARLVYSIGGYGNAFIPKKASVGGRLYVGEAAGFQDPMMGFGIEYALRSGALAAKAIAEGLDYERLWRKEILPEMKKDIARRFVLSLFGSRLIEHLYRNVKSGQTVELPNPKVSGPAGKLLEEAFFRIGWTKKRILGSW
jgi:flavin-dependent dehydrogenase